MKTVIVTGATSGIGLAVTVKLISEGCRVIGVGRDAKKCEEIKKRVDSNGHGGELIYFTADLMRQSEVRRVGTELRDYLEKNCGGKLDALVNNAGCVKSWYATTEDGYEQQFALNHLAGFMLTYLLLPCLMNAGGRVLMTSSGSHKMMRVHWDDPMFRKGYNPLLAYKQSKLCNMLFAYALNERFSGSGVHAYGVDPGLVATDIGLKQTGGLVSLVWGLRKKSGVSPEVPARTYAWIIDQTEAPKGLYYYLCNEEKYSKEVNSENAGRLFDMSERLCGISYGSLSFKKGA